jgi:tetratricopeptide (TPR) repeat protein
MKIFLSYSWADSQHADSIENFFSSIGISVIRDINDLKYRQHLRSFMTVIRDCDYSIIIVSDDYLKSPNCLYELIELYKEKEFQEKFVPILVDKTKIYSIENKLEVISYWKEKVELTKNLISTFEPTKTISLIKELKHYETIYNEIDSLLVTIAEFKNISLSEGNKTNFKDIIEFIGLENRDVKIEISRIQEIKNQETQDIELENLKKIYPGNLNILFAEGYINLSQRENYRKAKAIFEDYLKIKTEHSALNNMGLCLQNLEEFDNAEEYYEKALKLNSTHETYCNLGSLEAERKNYDKAISYYLKSIEINPNNAVSLFNIGKLYTDMKGDFENGIKYYKKAIECDSHLKEPYNNIASIYVRQNNYEEASIYLEKSIQINPNDYVSMYNLGAIYQNIIGKQRESKSLYRKSIRENPNYVSPKIGLAKSLILNGGDTEEAKELFRDILKLEPENNDIRQMLEYFEK